MTLMSGTVPAQAAMVLLAPVLTRLYAPTDFAMYALFVVGVNLISSVAPGRYDFALVLPEEDEEAVNLLALALGLSAAVVLVTFLLTVAFHGWLVSRFNLPGNGYWILLVSPGVLAYSWYNIGAKWQSRKERFPSMACAEAGGCFGSLATQITAGILLASPTGVPLICGHLLGRCIAVATMSGGVFRDLAGLRDHLSGGRIKAAAGRYWRFPVFSSTGILVGRAAHEVPKLMLAACFSPHLLGFYSLGMRVLGTPATVIGRATANVFFPRISRCRHDAARSRALLLKACRNLIALVSLPMLILFFWADWIFAFVFGEEWAPAGHYARLLIPMLAAQFVVAPIRNSMQAFEKQHVVLLWHACFLVFSVTAFALGQQAGSADVAILNYSLVSMVMYAVYVGMCLYYAGNRDHKAATGGRDRRNDNAVLEKKGPGLICRNGPKGASHKLNLVPFSRLGTTTG